MTHFGWRSVYWGLALLVVAWLVPFHLCVYDSPEVCPNTSPEELAMIRRSRPTSSRSQKYELVQRPSPRTSFSKDVDAAVPNDNTSFLFAVKRDGRILYAHLQRPALWAVAVLKFSYMWVFYFILTELPSFFTAVMHFSVQESNTASVLPWVVLFFTSNTAGLVVDWVVNRGALSRVCAWRVFASVGLLTASALLVAATYMQSNGKAIACMTAAMGALGLVIPIWQVNAMEIGGEHGGLTYTFVNNLANLAGILAPVVCGMLTDAMGKRAGFTAAFWLSAGVNVIGTVIYVVFVSAKSEQQLDKKKTDTRSDSDEEEGSHDFDLSE